jgi:peptidoglycan-N-acetylglucosamine deacetylase
MRRAVAFLLHPSKTALLMAVALMIIGGVQSSYIWAYFATDFIQPASRGVWLPEAHAELPVAALQAPRQHVDCTKEPCIALTFDDGPNPITTPQILDVLQRHNARASFFLVGSRVPGQERLVRRMFYSGHEIGNHSWSHPDFTRLSPAQMVEQVNRTQAVIAAAGVPAPTLFRPPYGAVNDTVKASVPLTFAMWNVDPLDWKAKDPHQATQLMLAEARPGAVFDLHDIYANTAQSLDPVIVELQKHYQLVTFSELMNLQPGQQGEYFGR